MRRAKAYSSSSSQTVSLSPAFSLQLDFVLQQKIAKINNKQHVCTCLQFKYCEKFTKNLFSEGSRSFKVIDVDKFKKPVTSACYDKQHVCAYLQPCSRYTR